MQQNGSLLSSWKKLLIVSLLLSIIAGFCGWLFTGFVTRAGDKLERIRVESLASTAAASFDANDVVLLRGNAEKDSATQTFNDVREQLKRVRDVNPDFRFVYLMRPKAENPTQMIFLADSEASDSPDYSACAASSHMRHRLRADIAMQS